MKSWVVDDEYILHNLDHFVEIKYEHDTIMMFYAIQTKGTEADEDFKEFVVNSEHPEDRISRFNDLIEMLTGKRF